MERMVAVGIVMLAEAVAVADEPTWQALPPLPDPIGVAGAFVGSHRDAIIVAGGSNFAGADAADLWTAPKRWHAGAYVLCAGAHGLAWTSGFTIPRPVANGASVSLPAGVVCLGGDDGASTSSSVLLLEWNPNTQSLQSRALAPLPGPCTAAAAAVVGGAVYVIGGQSGIGLESATAEAWRIDCQTLLDAAPTARWERLADVPTGPRAYALAAAQASEGEERLFLIGGRRMGAAGSVEPSSDLLEFSPRRHAADPTRAWRRLHDAPAAVMAGAAVSLGSGRLAVLTGDDGSRMAIEAADPASIRTHPGFPRRALAYDVHRDEWSDLGPTPANQVNSLAAAWRGGFVIASGEVRPRVRTRDVWWVLPRNAAPSGATP